MRNEKRRKRTIGEKDKRIKNEEWNSFEEISSLVC